MARVMVRYIVDDVDAAIEFYEGLLGFEVEMHPAPPFAMLARGDLRLALNQPGGRDAQGGGGRTLADGRSPEPGGWNRIALEVDDLPGTVERLRGEGAHFRSDIIKGMGVEQVIVDDPSGNPVELFHPLREEARLDRRG